MDDQAPEKNTVLIEEETADGRMILDRYKILEELATTRFSTVYKAFDSKMQRPVAIKMIEATSKATTWAKREAQLSAQLNHPNICTIYEYEETAEGHFLIMEYLEGLTLRQILHNCDTLSLDEAVAIVKEICLALEYAHLNYIIHQDIKPENILLLRDGRLKIMDFGTSRLLGAMKEAQKTLIGTPGYLAPEQIRKERLDDRCDQFSLAVVLFEMLAGTAPFEAKTTKATIFKVQSASAPRLEKLNPQVSEELAQVIEKAFSKKADARYPTMTDFRYKVERAHPPQQNTEHILASLVERLSSSYFDEGEKMGGAQSTILGGLRDLLGRAYLKNNRLLNRLFSALLVSGLGFILFTTLSKSYVLIFLGSLFALSVFFPSWGLLALGVVVAFSLTLKGFFWPGFFMLTGGVVWYLSLRRKFNFELTFSLFATLLYYVKVQVLFPVLAGIAFTPFRAFLVSAAGALQVLVFSAVWQGKTTLLTSPIELSQLITWPLASIFISFVLTKKTLAKAAAASAIAFVFLIATYIIVGLSQNQSFELVLKSASLSLIIAMFVLPLIPYGYMESGIGRQTPDVRDD